MGAVSLAQAKAALPGYSGTADDAAITTELARAEAQVAKFCGWPKASGETVHSFVSGTFTLYGRMDLADAARLLLRVPPSAVTSVHVSSVGTYDASTLLASTQYEIDEDYGHSLYALNGQTWSQGTRGNRVVCTAGWAEGSAPEDVVAAVLHQFVHRWRILRPAQGRPQMTQQGNSTARDALVAMPALAIQAAQASEAFSWRSA